MVARLPAWGVGLRLLGPAGIARAWSLRAWTLQAVPRVCGDLRGPGVAGEPGGSPLAGPVSAGACRAPDCRAWRSPHRGTARRPGGHRLVGARWALLVLLEEFCSEPEH